MILNCKSQEKFLATESQFYMSDPFPDVKDSLFFVTLNKMKVLTKQSITEIT